MTYRIKIINPTKKDVVVRDLRQFHGQVKLMEEFKDQVPETINFSVGYFVGRQSTKKWLVSQEDLDCMYTAVRQAGKTDICLWYDGRQEAKDIDMSQKRRRESSPVPTSRRAVKEKIDELFLELKETHVDDLRRMWRRMWMT